MKKIVSYALTFSMTLLIASILTQQTKAVCDHQLTINAHALAPEWSLDGERIVYFAFSGSWYRYIWTMNSTDGSDKTQLTSGSVVDARPAYSPDGTQIAFHRWGFRGDRHDLMIMDADGPNEQRLTFGGIPGMIEGSYEHPRWSEDGTKLVFQYNEGTTGGPSAGWWVCTINVDGSGLEVLGRGMAPRFCYGDTKIVFNTDPYYVGGHRIALMNADGSDVQLLTDGPNDRLPHMSSTTNRILFNRDGDLYVMERDGSNLAQITSDGTNLYAAWSPDEKYIAYSSDKLGSSDIWKMCAPPALISAALHIDPDTLNLKSNGQWIAAYVTLPEDYSVVDIDVATVKLMHNDDVVEGADWGEVQGDVLMVKFDRATLRDYLGVVDVDDGDRFYDITLTVRGNVAEAPFEGCDTITVKSK